jgi:hydrogenase nickel incorporation protein HypB
VKRVELEKKVISENEKLAQANREKYAKEGTFVLNLVSSPGSGKTRLIEETAKRLKDELRMLVLTGDLMTENDAKRVARHGVDAVQISTGGGCHLDAKMVDEKLEPYKDRPFDLVIVENVGNLVCPSSYDLGEDLKVLLIAVGEGDDKPLKYPPMVIASEVLVVNKMDLREHVDSDPDAIVENAQRIKPDLTVFKLSSKTGDGLEEWIEWLKSKLAEKRRTRASGQG